jgi:hypothetical protein
MPLFLSDAVGKASRRVKAQMKLADTAHRECWAMRSIGSFYIRYRLAAAHVHCARPVEPRDERFDFLAGSL